MGFVEILISALGASILVPIGMAFLSPPRARRTTLIAWAILLPTLVIGCGTLLS